MNDKPEKLWYLTDYLQKMLVMGASDLFLRTLGKPALRIQGQIVYTDYPTPTPEKMMEYADSILTPLARERFLSTGDIDISHTLPGLSRFRINLFRHEGQIGLVARAIPTGKLNVQDLNLPASILDLAEAPSGLILVVGPTGCGKSTDHGGDDRPYQPDTQRAYRDDRRPDRVCSRRAEVFGSSPACRIRYPVVRLGVETRCQTKSGCGVDRRNT